MEIPAMHRRLLLCLRPHLISLVVFVGVLVLLPRPAAAQSQAFSYEKERAYLYSELWSEIEKIKIFDNHGHPGFPDDPNVDAMGLPSDSSVPFRLRDDNPEFLHAAKVLFKYPYVDFAPDHMHWLAEKKAAEKRDLGNQYFSRILDQVGIETAIANRVSMPPYLDPSRFLWVFFVDNFLFPFDASQLESLNPDMKFNVPRERKLLADELASQHLNEMPANLSAYLAFATRVVEANKNAGGVGIKFEIAYFRSLHFDDPSEQRASEIYAKYHAGNLPSADEYRDFQDFMFRYLLREAARLHLPVQIHSSVGGGDYYYMQSGNALALENILRDPRYDGVTFDLLHGGYPFQHEAIWLTARKNVYLDSSLMELFLYPSELRRVLKQWLELFPDRIVFGSDTFPFSDVIGTEETYYIAVESARTALCAALAEMVADKEITEATAVKLAQGYLHDNAAKIYSAAPAQK
jgi:uncharacterized protein